MANGSLTSPYNVDYDYGSVMHYSPLSFSKNGLPTMTVKVTQIVPFYTYFRINLFIN